MFEKSWPSVSEFFSLLWTNLTVQAHNCLEYLKIVFHYYSNLAFAKNDLALRLMYLFNNPFSISKRFLMNRGEEEIYAYGETPLTSMEKIAKEAQITKEDTVFELGCGRGRTCFWLQSFVGCKVVGIEYVPEFVKRAELIKKKLGIKNTEFRFEDMLETDFTGATVIYLYGTCLKDDFIEKLTQKFATLPPGTKIITVSYPLMDYSKKPAFEVMKRFTVPYTWGDADVYVQLVKS